MHSVDSVAPGVWVATSRRDMTTSTVLVDGGTALLVDPAWEADELAGLAAWLRSRRLAVAGGFATHAHHDHVRWHPDFGDAPRWASRVTAARAVAGRAELISALDPTDAPECAELMGLVTGVDEAPWIGTELIVHDAHTPGHTALWLPGPRVLIAGDMLSDVEIPLLEETGSADYRAGLDALRPFVERAIVVIPGHGRVGDGDESRRRWAADQRYLDALDSNSEPDDPRLHSADMRAAHEANRVKR